MEMSCPSSLFVFKQKVHQTTSLGKCICHQNPSPTENPSAPSRELSPMTGANDVRVMKCAMGVSQSIPELGHNLSRKNSISEHIVVLILYWYDSWCTKRAARCMAKLVCWTRSAHGIIKTPVFNPRTMCLNSQDDLSRRALLSNNACVIDKYKWDSKWRTQFTPSARWANFPVSFCASDTLKLYQFECHVMLIKFNTS
jgi:hypothetical protein